MASPSDAASKEDEFFAQRRTVLAFLDFLRTAPLPPSVDSDALEVAADCLSEAFGVSPQNPDDLEKYSVLPGTLLQLIQDSTPGSATGHGSSAGAARPGGQLVENSQAAASLPEPMDEENKRDAEPREADLGDRVGGGSVAAGTENARIGNGDSGGREGGKEVEMKDAVEGATEQTGEQAKERAWETARGEAGAGGSGPNRQGEEGQVEAQGALDLEKKLQEFLQGLESAGYYAGTVVGSEEYVTRQQQARGIFHQCVAQQGGGREGGDKEQGDGGSEQGKEGGEKEGGEKEGGEKEGNEKEEEGGSKSSEGRKEQRGDKGKEKETEMGDASAATASGAAGGAASGAGGGAASGAGGGAASGVTASASAETVGGGGAAAAVVTEEDKKKAEELKAQGNAAMAAHNYEEALSLYSKAIALCGGTNAIYYANRAAAQHQLGNYMEAAADSRRAVAVDPRYSKAYSRLGHACMALGRHHEAIEEGFKKALELDPSNAAHKENLKAAKRKLDEQRCGACCSHHDLHHHHQHEQHQHQHRPHPPHHHHAPPPPFAFPGGMQFAGFPMHGMGMPGMGVPGMGIPGMGMPGSGMPGSGMPGPGMPGPGMPAGAGWGGAPGSHSFSPDQASGQAAYNISLDNIPLDPSNISGVLGAIQNLVGGLNVVPQQQQQPPPT